MSIIGNPILLSGGSSSLLNLPITVSQEEPTPERVGHLWVKLYDADNITKVEINHTVNPNAENGTLQLIPLNYDDKLNFAQYISVNGKKVLATMTTASDSDKWAITDESKGDTYCQFVLGGYPLVYSKINGILQNETAYVWTGEKWKLVSDNCSYWIGSTEASGLSVYHYVDGEILSKEFEFGNTADTYMQGVATDATYTFFAVYNGTLDIYKRTGSTFELITQMPATMTIPEEQNRVLTLNNSGYMQTGYRSFMFSYDGKYCYAQYSCYSYCTIIVIYRYNEDLNIFEQIQYIPVMEYGVQMHLNEYNEFLAREIVSGTIGAYNKFYAIDKDTGLYYKKFDVDNQLLENGTLNTLYAVANTSWLIGRTIIMWTHNEPYLNFIDVSNDTLTIENYSIKEMSEALSRDFSWRDNSFLIHPNKRYLLVCSSNNANADSVRYGKIYIVDKETGNVTTFGSAVNPICFSPDGTILYIQDSTKAIKKYDVIIDNEGNFSLSNGTVIINATSQLNGNLFIPSALRN